ncbi:unnamed protein product [Orchesella dallaii]|uniref:Uncharacterized protein n=1 Tax=Orchesella dallaii TaxID=48710 RepID=A0ABP1Q369_9HEXA
MTLTFLVGCPLSVILLCGMVLGNSESRFSGILSTIQDSGFSGNNSALLHPLSPRMMKVKRPCLREETPSHRCRDDCDCYPQRYCTWHQYCHDRGLPPPPG